VQVRRVIGAFATPDFIILSPVSSMDRVILPFLFVQHVVTTALLVVVRDCRRLAVARSCAASCARLFRKRSGFGVMKLLATVTTACGKGTARESLRRDRRGRLSSPAFHVSGSAVPIRARTHTHTHCFGKFSTSSTPGLDCYNYATCALPCK
jgi:hypothetical protein